MNWVGGIRNRVKLKQEKKLQKEFFERKRLQKKLKITNPISVNASSSRANGSSQQSISQDLLALQVITQTHDKPYRSNREIRLPTKVDLDHPNRHQPKFKNEEILDLPLPSSAKPSTLEFSEARDRGKQVKSPVYHQKKGRENIDQKVDSYEPDFNIAASAFPTSQEILRNVDSFYQKQVKQLELSEAFDFKSNHDKPPATYPFHLEERIENTDQEVNSYDLGMNAAPNFSLTQESMTLNKSRTSNVHSLYQNLTTPSAFAHDHSQVMKRKVDSFELNNFEDVKRSRQEELFLTKQRSTPAAIYEGEERYLKSKRSRLENQQQHYQQHLSPKYRKIEEQSPFIPYAAPAPYSLAARTTSYVGYEDTGFPNTQKSGYLASHPSSPRMERCSRQNDNYNDHNKLEGTMETFQPISHNAEHEKLFLAGGIHGEKINHDISITMENNVNDYPLPSPATNEITIECLNKSDPQSFLTDLQILEEIIPEDKRQPVKANPDTVMNIQHSPPQYTGQMDEKIDCNKMTVNVDGDNAEIEEDRSNVWRNFVTTAKRSNEDTLINDNKQATQNENDDNVPSITTENCSPRRSKIAAEELKEVMAVQQYESSQESSYYSSWSSSASENEDNRKSATTKSGKLSSKEVKQTNPKETIKVTSSQDLPSTSTSEQLHNNSQNKVYTLGLSNGLKHLSKTKELPARNPDQKGSNLSVFRIYPLSKSEEKATQTLSVKSTGATVSHKSMQCEIWTTNPLTLYPEGNSSEDKMSITDQYMNTGIHSRNDSGFPHTNTAGSSSRQNILKSEMGSFVDQGMKKGTGTNLKSYIGFLTSQDKKAHSSSVSSLQDKKTGTNVKQNSILKLDMASVNGQDTITETDTKRNVPDDTITATERNILKADMESLTGQDKNTETVTQQNILKGDSELPVETCETNVEIKKSNYRVPTPPLLDIRTNCLDNTTEDSDTATTDILEISQDTEREISNHDQHLQPIGYAAENIIPDTPVFLTVNPNSPPHGGTGTKIIATIQTSYVQSSELMPTEQNSTQNGIEKNATSVETTKDITDFENNVKVLRPLHQIAPNIPHSDIQSHDLVTAEHNSVLDRIEETVSSLETSTEITTPESKVKSVSLSPLFSDKTTIAGQTDKTTNSYGETDEDTIPNGQTDKTTMPHGETDKTTTHTGQTDTVKNCEDFSDTTPCSNSSQHDNDKSMIAKLKEDIERLQSVNVYQSIVIKSFEM